MYIDLTAARQRRSPLEVTDVSNPPGALMWRRCVGVGMQRR